METLGLVFFAFPILIGLGVGVASVFAGVLDKKEKGIGTVEAFIALGVSLTVIFFIALKTAPIPYLDNQPWFSLINALTFFMTPSAGAGSVIWGAQKLGVGKRGQIIVGVVAFALLGVVRLFTHIHISETLHGIDGVGDAGG